MSIMFKKEKIVDVGLITRDLTLAEYEALSETEKNNGVYYNITDDEDPTMFVSIVKQDFTDAQKKQARENIGAQSEGSFVPKLFQSIISNNGLTHYVKLTLNANAGTGGCVIFLYSRGGETVSVGFGTTDGVLAFSGSANRMSNKYTKISNLYIDSSNKNVLWMKMAGYPNYISAQLFGSDNLFSIKSLEIFTSAPSTLSTEVTIS